MKTLFNSIFIAVLVAAVYAVNAAPTLIWDASPSPEAEGYNVYCGPTPVPTPEPIDSGSDLTHDLAGFVAPGTEYECWVTAYAAGWTESADSNHVVFIAPGEPPELTAPTNLVVDLEPAPAGIVAEYLFEDAGGTVIDTSGGGNDGVLVGGAVFVAGYSGQGLQLDGTGRADFSGLDVTGQLTIAAMVNPTVSAVDARVLSKANGSLEQAHWWMLSTTTDGSFRFRLKAGGTTTTLRSTAGLVTPGVWSSLMAVYDGTEIRLYHNGAQVAAVAKTGAIDVDPAVPVAIGAQPDGSYGFNGVLDDIRIYNEALQ